MATQQTAYVILDGKQGRQVVTYSIGPVFIDLETLKMGIYRNSFRPQPVGGTFSTPALQIGEGQSGQYNGGSYVSDGSGSTDIVIAVPDEMQDPPIPPRTLERDKTYMVFYGEEGAPVVATRSSNTLVVGSGHPFRNGQLISLTTSNTLPAGAEIESLYYVVGRTSTAISIAHTPGGSAITLSDAGTGVHKVVPFKISGFFDMEDSPQFSNNPPQGLL